MNLIIIITLLLLLLGGGVEKSNHRAAVRIRGSRPWQSSKHTLLEGWHNLRGKPAVHILNRDPKSTPVAAAVPPMAAPKARRQGLIYEPPAAPPTPPSNPGGGGSTSAGGITVDFFHGLLMLVNAPYEGPNDALRQLRVLGEGGRQWDNGLIRLHQRMSDPADMRIDPFVSDHVVRAAAFGQAMVLELVEADMAMTALLNMTLAEINERGLQVPNTHR